MKRSWQRWLSATLLAFGLALGAKTWAAEGSYTLLRGVADQSSVFVAQTGDYRLVGSVGQPVANPAQAGDYQLGGEYWYTSNQSVVTPIPPSPTPSGPTSLKLYLPVVQR